MKRKIFILLVSIIFSNAFGQNNLVQPEIKNHLESIDSSSYDRVLKKYKSLIEKYPEKKELFYNLGNLNYLNGDTESAIQNYKNSLSSLNPIHKANALYNMGNSMYSLGKLEERKLVLKMDLMTLRMIDFRFIKMI